MYKEIKNIINKCGCIDIKILVLLFFILAILYSQYAPIKEECDCN